ncbi:MAG TPA: CDP-diacylglycerol--serine O-phosphatidyltransferase [Gemmatimonadaceae bacterium]
MRPPVPPKDMRRRVVVLFPSGLTLLNLFFGVWAIVAASREQFMQAGWYVILGGVADAFDGRVARATNSEGRFGAELDSLVDAITFGLAPAMIMYFAVMNRNGWDWMWCFFFTACAVLRLARFNVEQAGTNKTFFHGLPSPAAGVTLATYYWFSQSTLYNDTAIADWSWHQMLRLVMAALSFLMISNVPYPVLPPVGFRTPKKLLGLGVLLVGTAMLIFGRLEYFFPLAVGYVAFGLARGVLLGLLERRQVALPSGWFPGGDRDEPGEDESDMDGVSDGFADGQSGGRYFRRRRRRSRGDRGERGGTGQSNPT